MFIHPQWWLPLAAFFCMDSDQCLYYFSSSFFLLFLLLSIKLPIIVYLILNLNFLPYYCLSLYLLLHSLPIADSFLSYLCYHYIIYLLKFFQIISYLFLIDYTKPYLILKFPCMSKYTWNIRLIMKIIIKLIIIFFK